MREERRNKILGVFVCRVCLPAGLSPHPLSLYTSLSSCMSLSLGQQLCFLAPSMHRVSCHVSTNPTRHARPAGKRNEKHTIRIRPSPLLHSRSRCRPAGTQRCTHLHGLGLAHGFGFGIKAPGPWSSFRMESLAGIRRPVPCSVSGHIACNLGPSRVAGAGEQGPPGPMKR